MRDFQQRKSFRQDLKRELRGRYRNDVLCPHGELWEIVDILARDILLPYSYHDHALHGDKEGSRECHIRPDLLLVYRYEGDDLLILERLGSHSEILGL